MVASAPSLRGLAMGLAVWALLLWLPDAAPAGEALRVGAAAVSITPPLGVPLAGYYRERLATGVHDDLFAKCLALEAGGVQAALVSLDLISTTAPIVQEARRQIAERTGIPAENVMISATHSHTGPVLPRPSRRTELLGGTHPRALQYARELPERIAEGVVQAHAALQPARVLATTGHEDSIAFNRRYFMKNGQVGWNPGKLNPEIDRPAGTIDPAVPFVHFQGEKGEPIATYVNYAVHLDNVGGQEISADMPHTVADCLAAFQGPGMLTLYTTGTCGDVNHVDVTWREPQRGHENAARMGIILAAEVLRCWPRLEPVGGVPLHVRRQQVELPLAPITPEQVRQAEDVVRRLAENQSPAPAFLEQVEAFKVLDVAQREGQPLEVEVQVVTAGRQLAWVALPGEIFVELGLAIKADSPFPQTMITTLANGSIGYIPSRRAYPQGNYEVVSARCAEGSGEMLVEVALELLRKAHDAAGP